MQQRKRITLKDIAIKTGFTINTVSRALKDKDDISDETKRIIQETAKGLGYIEDVAASSLRSGSTRTLAVIVSDISNPLFGSMVRDIELAARKNGYTIIIFNTGENTEWERNAILSAYSKRVDGIIICPVQKNTENVELLREIAVPFILIGRYFKQLAVDAVIWDDVKAGELATRYFIDQGHVNILYIGGPAHISSGEDRLRGYRNALKAAGIPVKDELIRITNITAGASREMINQVLKEGIPFTALVIFSDLMAYEALRTFENNARKLGVRIPIASFDNIQEKTMLPFHFPSVGSREDISRICVERLLKLIQENWNHEPEMTVLDVELCIPTYN